MPLAVCVDPLQRVGDENGPRGGVDKFCRIQVDLIDAPTLPRVEIETALHSQPFEGERA